MRRARQVTICLAKERYVEKDEWYIGRGLDSLPLRFFCDDGKALEKHWRSSYQA